MYIKRLIEAEFERALASCGAVLVTGPRFCGKTTTSTRYQKSMVKLSNSQIIQIAKGDPRGILEGEIPRLIDEWQKAPDVWNYMKEKLDEDYRFGSFILTGSSTPADKTRVHHSGTGRITTLQMRPMSLLESGESDASASLSAFFDGEDLHGIDQNEDFSLSDVAFLLCRGGWPISVIAAKEIALEVTRNYYNGLFFFEDSENERFRNKRPEVLRSIVRSYARNISTEASIKTILEDVRQNGERSMDRKTFDSYLEALRDIFVITDMEAWTPSIRSKTAIRSTPTRHFVDTSIACRSLGISPEDLLKDAQSFGLFFEDMAVRDLSVYAQALRGEVRHYRDASGLECDAVLHLENGKWAAIEIKLGGENLIESGAASLLRLKNKLEKKSNEQAPSFCMVLTATGPLYKREDGVLVVPINKLGV